MKNYAEQILDKTNGGLTIFNLYMPIPFIPKKKFRNPFYEDRKPSCYIYYDKGRERYCMKDHGDDTYSGDCFWLVGLVLGLDCEKDFLKIAATINNDLGLGLDIKGEHQEVRHMPKKAYMASAQTQSAVDKPKSKKYKLVKKETMNKSEQAFWERYGIDATTLNKFNVVALHSFSSEGENGPYTIYSSPERMMFGYLQDDFVKIYRPNDKCRFLYGGEKPRNYCFGLKQLPTSGDTVFITGGEKDVITLAAHGYNAVCCNSETGDLPKDVMSILSSRFRHIIIMYDSDETGIRAMKKQVERWSDIHLLSITLPLAGTKQEKDISDFFATGRTAKQLNKLIGDAIATTYEESLLLISACEMDFSNPPIESERVVMVGDVPISSCDNLTCISGGEGTGKSNFVSSLLAGAILTKKPEASIDTLGFDILPNTEGKAVVHVDTEQSEQQLYKNTMMMLRRSGLEALPKFFHSLFFTTSSDRADRLKLIQNSLSLYNQMHGGIYMVVIDGVADLIDSANDEKRSVDVVDALYKLASSYHCSIVCVLHYVPNGLKLRGHLGSELQRKAATILSVEKDENPQFSVIKTMKLRDGNPLDVPIQQISWSNEHSMFTFVGSKSKEETAQERKEKLMLVAQAIYKTGNEGYTHTELVKLVEEKADVKTRTAKTYISELYEDKVIVKRSDKYVFNKEKQ